MITTPTDVKYWNIIGGRHVTWTRGASPADRYEIYLSKDGGAYNLVGISDYGASEYDDTSVGGTINSYIVRGINALTFSDYIRSKNDYDDYTIEPMVYSDGSEMHIEFQRGNIVFASKTGYLMWSTDKGYNFSEYAFTDAKIITFSYIFGNGNVLFATNKNELWLGKNGLTSITQKYLLNADGTPFVFHTPVNPLYPGIYFNFLCINRPMYQGGNEMLVWNNYVMYDMPQMNGATPSIVYYTKDQGETIKICYRFGYSGAADGTDDGTASGGLTGNPLGDLTNPVTCRHIHFVEYDVYENKWFIWTGEGGTFLTGTYNAETDTWNWTVAMTSPGKMYRCCGLISTPTHYIIPSDNVSDPAYKGVWKFLKSELTDYTKGVQIHASNMDMAPVMQYGNTIICGTFNLGMEAEVSKDGGETWTRYSDLPLNPVGGTGGYNILRIIGFPNSESYFLVTPYNWYTEVPYEKQSYLIKFK